MWLISHRISDALQQVELLLDHQDRDAQHGAVGGDQGQEDAQRLIERRRELLEHDLDHLHEGRNHEDEDDRLHIDDVQRHEHIGLNQPRHDGRNGHHEGYGSSHAQRSLDFRRHAQKGADAEELRQHDVVDEDGADDDCKIGKLHNYFLANLLNNTIR